MYYPKKVQIEVTNMCNLNCDGCLRKHMKREKGFITWDTYMDAIYICHEFGIEEIHLHHLGEPLLHPKILNCIKIAKALGFRVGFTTNGSQLTNDKLIELKKAGLDKLDISYNKNTKGFFISPKMLEIFYHVANNLGIETWFRSVVFSKEEYEDLLDGMDDYYIKFQRGMYFDKDKIRDKPCKSIRNIFVIQWDGKIIPCTVIHDDSQYSYGNVKDITVEKLKSEIDMLDFRMKIKSVNIKKCCKHCFEVENDLPLSFKL